MSQPNLFSISGLSTFVDAVSAERFRQLTKWGDQRHPDGTGDKPALFGMPMAAIAEVIKGVNADLRSPLDYSVWLRADEKPTAVHRPQWLPIFLEEVFEAAAEADPEKLRVELIQVAAVCAAWISDIDRRPTSSTTKA